MPDAVLLTAQGGGPESVLPALALLTMRVEIAPLTISALVSHLDSPVIILDGRRDLVSARTLCKSATEAMNAPPILLVLDEGGFAVVSGSWGASDTILHSASPAELQARLRMLREHASAPAVPDEDSMPLIEVGPVSINPSAFTVSVGGQEIDLTFKEFELLRYLAEHPRQVISRQALLEDVWGDDYYGGSRTVDVHVRRLRAKLGPSFESLISTVRNVGYRLDPSNELG